MSELELLVMSVDRLRTGLQAYTTAGRRVPPRFRDNVLAAVGNLELATSILVHRNN